MNGPLSAGTFTDMLEDGQKIINLENRMTEQKQIQLLGLVFSIALFAPIIVELILL